MTAKSFTLFGLAMIPYIAVFNFWYGGFGPGAGMFTGFMWLDFLGNLGFMGGSFWAGWLLSGEGEEEGKGKGKTE